MTVVLAPIAAFMLCVYWWSPRHREPTATLRVDRGQLLNHGDSDKLRAGLSTHGLAAGVVVAAGGLGAGGRVAGSLVAGGFASLASDDPLWIEEHLIDQVRAETSDETASSSGGRLLRPNRYNWRLMNKRAAFSARYAHAAVMNERQTIFIIGGATKDLNAGGSAGYLNDVWMSVDHGVTWRLVQPRSDRFSPRRGHAAVMNSDQVVMFVLGGFRGKDAFMNDWWSSEGGEVWHKLGEGPWSARHGHAVVMTSKDNLVLFGGHDGSKYLNDVWSIQDPAQALQDSTWEQVSKRAPWAPRYGHAATIDHHDAILLLGGFSADKSVGRVDCFSDVWRSKDGGRTWHLIVKRAPWSGRYQHTALDSAHGQVFVTGGLDEDLNRCNDVWRSKDGGESWDLVTAAAPWAARYEHAAVIDANNSLFIVGGLSTSEDKYHDVWRSARSCHDDVSCKGEEHECRDGFDDNFEGMVNPICVGICDRRIFDECNAKEACKVKKHKAFCVDPCNEQHCKHGEVCEVAPRDEKFHDVLLHEAKAYCLACDDAKTKFACDKLRQCEWSPADEACQMKCEVAKHKHKCDALDYCEWTDKKCAKKEAEEEG